MENENQTPHKRRVHYKGKYPKKFEEKYKELQPEKYKDTIAHVIEESQNTPAMQYPPRKISYCHSQTPGYLNVIFLGQSFSMTVSASGKSLTKGINAWPSYHIIPNLIYT